MSNEYLWETPVQAMLRDPKELGKMKSIMKTQIDALTQELGKSWKQCCRVLANEIGIDYATLKNFVEGKVQKPSEKTLQSMQTYLDEFDASVIRGESTPDNEAVVGDSALEEELDRRKDELKKIEEWWAARFQDVNDELQMMKQSRFANCHEVSHLADHLSADELAELVFTTAHMFKFGMVDEDEEPEGKVLNPLEIDSGEDGRPLICTERGRVVVIVRHLPCPSCE